jgi:hypothetical protein
VEIVSQGQTYGGVWAVEGQTLMIQLPTGMMAFQAALEGDVLVLADMNGTYRLERVTEAQPTSPAPTGAGQPNVAAGPLTDLQFLRFVEYYRQMQPDGVLDHLARTTPEQAQSFTIWEAFGADVHFAACLGSKAGQVVWQSLSGPMTCPQIVAQRQETIQLAAQMGLGDPFSEAETQRLQVINMYKCSLGIHSRELCGAYANAQAAVGAAVAGVGETILENMGCTERWEQQSNDPNTKVYLGCW